MPDDYKPLIDLNFLPADLISSPVKRDFYAGHDPGRYEGRERIKLDGSVRGREVASFDYETREVVRDKEVLRELARREFAIWWDKAKKGYFPPATEDPNSFDVELIQRLFIASFRETYTTELRSRQSEGITLEERVLPPAPASPSARILSTHHSEGCRLYEVELVDPEYPDDRIRFEVQVGSHGETDVRE